MTDIALRDYLDRRIDELDRRMVDRFVLSDAAVAKAERTMNERLNSMNEFRDALRDQANRMATRLEVEKIDEVVRDLQKAKANLDGRLLVMASGISIFVSMVLWLVARFVRP
jgi:membrane protein required for beta-lactamase induction